MAQIWSDIRYGTRTLLKAKGVTVVALLTLAIAIGANTAIFSVVNAAMLRPLPYPNAERLMAIYHKYTKLNLDFSTVYPFAFDYYRKHATSFDQVAALTNFHAPANLTGAGDPQRVTVFKATANFFNVLGNRPMIGRTFSEEEDKPGNNRVAVLSYATWKSTFGGAQILNREITLDGANYTVIGVMPQGFEFPEEAQVWIPMAFDSKELAGGSEYLQVVGTLRPGSSVQQAQAEMQKLTAEILAQGEDKQNTVGWSARTLPLQAMSTQDVRTALWILLGAVGCVLLIACANIANLLLARATARQREIAIRTALGATRWRVVRQLLTEGLLLGLVGGSIGLLVAYVSLDLLLKLVPVHLPSYIHVKVDPIVLAFTFAVSVVTGILFSVIPALQVTKVDNAQSLKDGATTAGIGRHMLRAGIAVGQLALAMMLLVSAGLLIKTFVHLQQSDMGFNAENVLTFRVPLPEEKYKEPAQTLAFWDSLQERLRSMPGVKNVAVTSQVPLTRNWSSSFSIQGHTYDVNPHAHVGLVSPDYFATLQIPLLKGRTFTPSDRGAETQQVAMIDENAARMYFGSDDPVGQKVMFTFEGTQEKRVWRTIVGVVRSVKHLNPLENETKGQVFIPYYQLPLFPGVIAVMRTDRDPAQYAADARKQVLSVDPSQPIMDVKSMQEIADRFVAQPRFNMVLLGLFAAIALVLSAIGVYGVMAYSVTQRTREIGVRMALGATAQDVLKYVLGQGWRIVTVGLAGGLLGTFAATRVLATLLYGVKPLDLMTYVQVALVLVCIAMFATYVPARRATKVNPVIALRSE